MLTKDKEVSVQITASVKTDKGLLHVSTPSQEDAGGTTKVVLTFGKVEVELNLHELEVALNVCKVR